MSNYIHQSLLSIVGLLFYTPFYYMGVSKNNGTPKSSILIGFSIMNHPFWDTTICGNTHIHQCHVVDSAPTQGRSIASEPNLHPTPVVTHDNGVFGEKRNGRRYDSFYFIYIFSFVNFDVCLVC